MTIGTKEDKYKNIIFWNDSEDILKDVVSEQELKVAQLPSTE